MKNSSLAHLLMYLGTLPFLACAIYLFTHPFDHYSTAIVHKIVSSYTLIIGSFMAGIHWGQHLDIVADFKRTKMIFSNLVALGFWFAFLLLPLNLFYFAASFLFLLILSFDHFLHKKESLQRSYILNRLIVSLIVVGSLVTIGVSAC